MASTIQLLNTLEFSKKLNFNRRSNLGNFQEPALTSANIVMQTIMGPPFTWRFNRKVITFTATGGTQDYVKAESQFGWIETATIQDTVTTKWFEMENRVGLSLDSSQGRSKFVSCELDDGAGNLTFRLMPVPDKAYPVSIILQQKAPLFTSLSQTWSPIPDEYSYIYNYGFLSLMWLFADDPRFGIANSKFTSALLGANQGLSETQRNIFLSNWSAITGQPVDHAQRLSQGIQARQV